MSRENYQADLADLEADVLAMGELVSTRLAIALDVLETGDEADATTVLEGDDEVNEIYLDLEGRCVDLIALQQPVAADLRFVVASFKIATDIERVGDLATNLAGYGLAAEGEVVPGVDVAGIGREARELVQESLAAYADGDADACRRIADADDHVDALCARASERVARDLIEREAGANAWTVEGLIDDVSRVLLSIRDVERVADHGVNIAARTLYMVENDPELVY